MTFETILGNGAFAENVKKLKPYFSKLAFLAKDIHLFNHARLL